MADINIRTCCIIFLLWFCCIFFNFNLAVAAANDEVKSAMVVGTVYCDTCFHQAFSKSSHFISGASVAVECEAGAFRKEAKTNRHGVFRIRLPPNVSRLGDAIKSCSVQLIKSNEPFCAVASSATSSGLHLKSKRNGVHVLSAGFFTFKPLNQPELCYQQEPKTLGFSNKQAQSTPSSSSSLFFFFPPIPFLPSPPNIGGIPLPPNPLMPPPSLLPPLIPSPPPSLLPPLTPSPPPSLLPPIFPTPPSSLLPPLPFITPPPPPPASLFPPFPIPFPPNPLFPGNPPHPEEGDTSP